MAKGKIPIVFNYEILNYLKELNKKIDTEKPMGTKEAAEFLHVNPDWLTANKDKKEIPYHKRLGNLYFYKSELNDWIRADKEREDLVNAYIQSSKDKADRKN